MAKKRIRGTATDRPPRKHHALLIQKERTKQLIEGVYRGESIAALAQRLGIGQTLAYRLYWTAIESVNADIQKYSKLLLAEKIATMRYLKRKLDPGVQAGNNKDIATRLKVEQEENKLLNLYPDETPREDNRVIIVNFPGLPSQSVPVDDQPMLSDFTSYTHMGDGSEEQES